MSADRPARACCLDARERLSSRTVRHSLLEVVLSALREAIHYLMDGVASPPVRKAGRSGRRRPGTPNPTQRLRALRSTGTQ